MSRQFFVSTSSVRPPQRWQQAFPDGIAAAEAEVRPVANSGDIVWVSTSVPGWERLVRLLATSERACPVAVLSFAPGDDEGIQALGAGARAYCHALAVPELLREVAQAVRHGGLWVGTVLMSRILGAAGRALPAVADETLLRALTDREAEVARAAATGQSNKEIAATLGVTERTVKAHLAAVFEKLGVRDRLQLVLRFSQQGVPVEAR
ncbi:MAG TPA: LuxR C-terminal-related transcriptional regulator [Aromatoleum sp.]|uniref:LuxR C-terminal-related transcriptional regulator n=1 Tax=Aromatoleum sp. TaxID=2307007 RepID=UPI002B4A3E3C|nr:LuxR C-terminal-related transcriptional regulator [Aromatoleum sp.]HJV28540.1 LuxR C-terminal-related transcriptional regulator [Aromatoleum sp.]